MNANSADVFHSVFMIQEKQTHICTISQVSCLRHLLLFKCSEEECQCQNTASFSRRGNLNSRTQLALPLNRISPSFLSEFGFVHYKVFFFNAPTSFCAPVVPALPPSQSHPVSVPYSH